MVLREILTGLQSISGENNEPQKAEDLSVTPDQPTMTDIVRSVLQLSQEDMFTLGMAAKQREEMLSPFQPPATSTSEAGRRILSSYPLRNVFPEVELTDFAPAQQADVPEAIQQVSKILGESIDAMKRGDREKQIKLLADAIKLSEHNNLPTFNLKMQRASATGQGYRETISLFEEAIEYCHSNGKLIDLTDYLRNLAAIYDRLGKKARALELLDEAWDIFQSLTPEKLIEIANDKYWFKPEVLAEVFIRIHLNQIQDTRSAIKNDM
jgi:tetratricopeptide (TPR) repeat protein